MTVAVILAACRCTAAVMVVAGRLVCGRCSAEIKVQAGRPERYTSAKTGPRPPRWSARRFREFVSAHLDEIDGAKREGGKRGRTVIYTCPADAFHDFIERGPRSPSNVVPFDVDRAIERAAYRLTRGTR